MCHIFKFQLIAVFMTVIPDVQLNQLSKVCFYNSDDAGAYDEATLFTLINLRLLFIWLFHYTAFKVENNFLKHYIKIK